MVVSKMRIASVILASLSLAACGFVDPESAFGPPDEFACTQTAKAAMPALKKNLTDKLATQEDFAMVQVGQCYEGGRDGYQFSFASPDLRSTVDVLQRSWTCRDLALDESGSSGTIRCKVSNMSVDFEVDHSIGLGSGYASLVSKD
jgi:hypothetical protein